VKSKLRTSAIAAAATLVLAHGAVLVVPVRHRDGIALGETGLIPLRLSSRRWSAGSFPANPDRSEGESGDWSLFPFC